MPAVATNILSLLSSPSASENVYTASLRHERDVVPTFRQLCLLKTLLGCRLWAVFTRPRKKRPSFVLSWTALLTEGVFEIDRTSTTKNAHTRSPSLPSPCKGVVEVMSARVYCKTHAGNTTTLCKDPKHIIR